MYIQQATSNSLCQKPPTQNPQLKNPRHLNSFPLYVPYNQCSSSHQKPMNHFSLHVPSPPAPLHLISTSPVHSVSSWFRLLSPFPELLAMAKAIPQK